MTNDELFEKATEAHMRGDVVEAERLYREVLGRQPGHSDTLANLGLLLANRGDMDGAVASYHGALREAPGVWTTHYNLGQAYRTARRWEDAAASYTRALALEAEADMAWLGLAVVRMAQGRTEEALEVFRKALAAPLRDAATRAALLGNRATLYRELGRSDFAEEDYRAALNMSPETAMLWNNLAEMCFATGRGEEGLAGNQKARDLAPAELLFASNRLFHLQFMPGWDARMMRDALAAWRVRFADPVRGQIRPHPQDRDPERRLRIGYVSPNFRDHCQALFVVPLLAHHNPAQVEVVCYGDVNAPDGITAQTIKLAHGWRDVTGSSDEQLAEIIRRDRIDVLVDLTMHMAGNRLRVLARKPAPVQVTWLAYPGSTGLDVIDYRLTDPYLDPPGMDESVYAEKTWRLPATFWCYDPLDANIPEPGPPPALANGYVTFGCLNNFVKVNPEVLKLWARVLSSVKGSRLLLLADEGAHRERVLQTFESFGVGRERVRFAPRQARADYLKLYQQIDIGLDTFPYNGHTTSLDSYYMGVPVVTLVGQTVVGRAGLSQLMNLGMPELIGRTEEEYVGIAARLAGDLGGLAKIRAGLRVRMEKSPLMDAEAFARGIEGAFRAMWRRWCAGGG